MLFPNEYDCKGLLRRIPCQLLSQPLYTHMALVRPIQIRSVLSFFCVICRFVIVDAYMRRHSSVEVSGVSHVVVEIYGFSEGFLSHRENSWSNVSKARRFFCCLKKLFINIRLLCPIYPIYLRYSPAGWRAMSSPITQAATSPRPKRGLAAPSHPPAKAGAEGFFFFFFLEEK